MNSTTNSIELPNTITEGHLISSAEKLTGVFPAIVTPMLEGGEIDFKTLEILVEDLLLAGVHGLCVCGTTGQSATLNHQEHISVALFVLKTVNGRCPVIVSAGSNSTEEAIYLMRSIEEKVGATTFLHVTGYYNCPPQQGLLKHYQKLSNSVLYPESNLIVYNVPGRTSSNISTETMVQLAEDTKIIGVKDACCLEQATDVIEKTKDVEFTVLSGNDEYVSQLMSKGGLGTISASANIAPKLFVGLYNAAIAGDFKKSNDIQKRVNKLVDYVFSVRNPIPLMAAIGSSVRLPLCHVEEIKPLLAEIMSEYSTEELGIDLMKYQNR